MSNFIEDPFVMPTKVDGTPMPGGEDPDEFYRAEDYGEQRTAFSDIRNRLTDRSFPLGDGSDGDVVISSNTTLTRDMFYASLTINSGITLNPGGYRIHCKGVIHFEDATAKIAANGGSAAGATAGTPGGVNASYLTHTHGQGGSGGSTGSGPGGTGNNSPSQCPRGFTAGFAAGGAATPGAAGGIGSPGQGGGGGNYGWPSGGGGSNGGTVNLMPANNGDIRAFPAPFTGRGGGNTTNFVGGTGGGGGRGSSTVAGTGGGGGGGGGFVIVVAREITGAGSIEAKGGNGGNASAGGDGGGGGGGAGGIVIVCICDGSFPTISVIGGGAGTGATDGTRTGGNGGVGGAGLALTFKV